MVQKSRSKIAILPLVLFVLIPIIGYVAFKQYGVFFIALFITPSFSAINQFFRSYKIKSNQLIINEMFGKKEISSMSIRQIENKQANIFQKILVGFPDEYQIVHYNTYDDLVIMPQKELVFNAETEQLYFKN